MEIHLAKYCPKHPDDQREPLLGIMPTVQLPFELLPPGSWDIRHVIAYYRDRKVRKWLNAEIDSSRLIDLKTLEPIRCFVGRKMWLGYIVFKFKWSGSVILECPITGNATYVLSGNWQEMIGKTKALIRTRFPRYYTRVIHKGNWLGRVRGALRGNPTPDSIS